MSAFPAPSRRAVLVLALCLAAPLRAVPASPEIFADAAVAALAEAALSRDAPRAAALVAQGASLAAQGRDGVTLLQWAMFNKSHSGFGILLDLGARPDQPGMDGDTALHFAAKANDAEYLRLMLAHGASCR